MQASQLEGRAGINLKPQHYDDALSLADNDCWFEVHTENYFVGGGPRLDYLHQIAERFALSFHGVGGSLGNPLNNYQAHLQQVAKLVKAFQPALVSEHATWSGQGETYFAELLPLPKTQLALNRLCDGVDRYQNAIGRTILLENPSNYLDFSAEIHEADFLMEVANRTGCGLLLDVNNLYISHRNCGLDIAHYLANIAPDKVGEIHIAGFDLDANFPTNLLIDSHAAAVHDDVWQLLDVALQRFGPVPTLLERDDNIPSFDELFEERQQAQAALTNLMDYRQRRRV